MMKKTKTVTTMLVLITLLTPRINAQQKTSFTPLSEEAQSAQVDSLTAVYQQEGVNEKEAYLKAYEQVFGEEVSLRYNSHSGPRPEPHDSSILVDRNPLYHSYLPIDLVRKVLLKASSAEYEARIQNVRYVGAGGDGEKNQTTWHQNASLPPQMWTNENRSLTTFEGDKYGRFPFEKGLLLTTGESHCVEGPNKQDNALSPGVTSDLKWCGVSGVTNDESFDADITYVARLGQSTAETKRGGLLEFDFSPASSEVSFEYIFGSEEYATHVWSNYNDVFGFFVSGPFDTPPDGSPQAKFKMKVDTAKYERRPVTTVNYSAMTGAQAVPMNDTVEQVIVDGEPAKKYIRYNIARLPNGDPVGVNSVNWGYRNGNPSTLSHWGLSEGEYVYPDVLPFDKTPNAEGFATNLLPNFRQSFPSDSAQVLFKDQRSSQADDTPFTFDQERAVNMVYHRPIMENEPLLEINGITTNLKAKADGLVPNKWYHLKLVVAQVDTNHGDVVFLSNLDLGESKSKLEPIPEKEGEGWKASWDTIYGAIGDPTNQEARFTLYDGCDRKFTIEAQTTTPGSYLILRREGLAKTHLTLLLNGKPMTSDSILLPDHENSFKLTLKPQPVPPEFEGEKGQLLSFVNITPGNVDTIINYTAYNRPTTKVRYHAPTLNYVGVLDLGIEGGTPYLFRSMDRGKSWKLASVPFSPREILNTLDVDSIDIWLREPNSSGQDIIVPLKFGTAPPLITRTVTLPAFPYGTMDQVQGNHIVSSRQDFELIIRPDAAHADKTPIIRTNRQNLKDEEGGLQVTKQADGSYLVVIKSVNEDFEITFDMVVSNEASIENGHVWTHGKQLLVHATSRQPVEIYTLSGVLTKRFTIVAGETRSLLLPAGVYLVRLKETGEVYKARVSD